MSFNPSYTTLINITDIPAHSMTYDRFVKDCNELIDHLRNRFRTPKVFIVAHSGGTVIGMKTVYKYPEKVYAYVGVGQSIDGYDEQKVAYDFVLEQAEKTGDLNSSHLPMIEEKQKYEELLIIVVLEESQNK